jgi:hypothetical protein
LSQEVVKVRAGKNGKKELYDNGIQTKVEIDCK